MNAALNFPPRKDRLVRGRGEQGGIGAEEMKRREERRAGTGGEERAAEEDRGEEGEREVN